MSRTPSVLKVKTLSDLNSAVKSAKNTKSTLKPISSVLKSSKIQLKVEKSKLSKSITVWTEEDEIMAPSQNFG
jgi:hypothetical protein